MQPTYFIFLQLLQKNSLTGSKYCYILVMQMPFEKI